MMRLGTFSSSLLFAALAGLASVPYLMMGNSWGLGAIALVVGYLVAIAPSWSRALRIGILAAALGLVLGLLAPSPEGTVLGAAFLLGVLRSGFLYRSRPLRALMIETALLGAGFVLAEILRGYDVLDVALGIWGFFLVQSLYFLIGGIEHAVTEPDGIDPFVKAREEATRLMDDVAA